VALKAAAGRPGPQLELIAEGGLRLRPVATDPLYQCSQDIYWLTTWRNKFVKAFLTEFVATEARTSKWLAEAVGPSDDRVLFMIDDRGGETIGYMGIGFIDWDRRHGEADAIVRGRNAEKGSMNRALKTLIEWAAGQLAIETFGVRVRSDNEALLFYQRFGFIEQYRVPLSRRTEEGTTIWYENPNAAEAEVSLVHHLLARA
jgi:RimJ/RimL family protein N-acetyltransferase